MIIVDQAFLDPFVKEKKRYSPYKMTVDIADHLKFHIDGYNYHEVREFKQKENPYFTNLIDIRRPSESLHIQEYRRRIYLPITKQPCFKVLNSLKKIVKSPDWKIDFSHSQTLPKFSEEDQLEDYTSDDLPFAKSVENWFYNMGLKEILTDPNGLIYTIPVSYDVKDNTEPRKPYPYFVASEKIYDFVDGEYVVFESNKTYEYLALDGITKIKDFVIIVITTEAIYEIKRINGNGDYQIVLVLELKFGKLPVRRGGGIYKCIIDNSVIYDSFLSPILPGLDAAARESSDLDAEVVQHIFSTMWYYSSQGCTTCNGGGRVMKAGKQIVCGTCEGNGVVKKSPYKDLVIKPSEIGQNDIKAPYAGYIEKNIEIVKIQNERIEAHIYKALSAINMEFLADSPLNQSGKAKEVDKDELNNFVYGIAYHSVENVIKPIYEDINNIRVQDLELPEETREELLPTIPIPERFEILTENYLQDQVISAKNGKLDPLIVSGLEMDFVAKKFETVPEVRDSFRVIKLIDPLPDLTDEEINNSVLNGTVLKSDAIIHKYKNFFVKKAIFENDGFLGFDLNKQVEIVKKYAADKILELDAEDKAKQTRNTQALVGQINAQ